MNNKPGIFEIAPVPAKFTRYQLVHRGEPIIKVNARIFIPADVPFPSIIITSSEDENLGPYT
jgi:hypothetical protein